MRVRLIENGAAAFIPGSLILANKERLVCNGENGTVSVDKEIEYRLGDVLEIVLAEVNLENRNLVAKPTRVFADVKTAEEVAPAAE
jgi:exoribonuclease-2